MAPVGTISNSSTKANNVDNTRFIQTHPFFKIRIRTFVQFQHILFRLICQGAIPRHRLDGETRSRDKKGKQTNGGPVTVTDKRIIRYFMTIPEAAQLVLLAGAMAERSQIFVLDMGSPVSILELAENLIRLSGFTPYVDMPIVETGLRPGEKLYEELLTRSENLTATSSKKIFIENEKNPVTPNELKEKFAALEEALAADNAAVLVETMHRLVPTFRPAEVVNAEAIADLNYQQAVKA